MLVLVLVLAVPELVVVHVGGAVLVELWLGIESEHECE